MISFLCSEIVAAVVNPIGMSLKAIVCVLIRDLFETLTFFLKLLDFGFAESTDRDEFAF